MMKRISTASTFLVSVALLFGTNVASEQIILSVEKQSPNNIDQNRQGIRSSHNTRRRKAIEEVTEVESAKVVRSAFGNALLQRRKSNLEHKLVGKTDAEEEIDAGNFWKFGGMSMPGGSDPGDSTGTSPNPDDGDDNGGEDPPIESPPTTTSSATNPGVTIPTPAPTEMAPVDAPTEAPVAGPGTTDPFFTLAPTVLDADPPKPNSNMPGSDAPLPTQVVEDPDERTLAPTQLGFNTPPPTSGAQRGYSSNGGTLVLVLGLLWAC
mmetsp:Transcript_16914/g.34906  ORF Transcript_16914/g.34906 Transcript_16914/m.34906 type:complete len:265 (-) Transcript_16914:356-1150(-)